MWLWIGFLFSVDFFLTCRTGPWVWAWFIAAGGVVVSVRPAAYGALTCPLLSVRSLQMLQVNCCQAFIILNIQFSKEPAARLKAVKAPLDVYSSFRRLFIDEPRPTLTPYLHFAHVHCCLTPARPPAALGWPWRHSGCFEGSWFISDTWSHSTSC